MTTPTTETFIELARNSSRRPEATRWTEIILSAANLTNPALDTIYRVEIIGRSVRPGETDRVRTEESTSPQVIVEAVAPRDSVSGRPRLTWAARKTLLEASEFDPLLGEAVDDFDALFLSEANL